jgi:hypothetical protein
MEGITFVSKFKGICCYSFLGFHTKMKKYKKQIQKIFERNPKNNRSEKRMLECRKMAKIG